MPKQTGIAPLQGTIGNITFSKRGKNNHAQEKTHVAPNRFLEDPRFARARENAAEFTRAAAGGRVLRLAFKSMLKDFKDKSMSTRMHSIMTQVVKSDPVNARGLRTVTDGNLALLEGFDFNGKNSLKEFFDVAYTVVIDRVAGTLNADIPAFIPLQKIPSAPGSTHFKLIATAAEIDFETEAVVVNVQSSASLIWGDTAIAPVALRCTVTPNSTLPLFLALGIQYYQEVNGLLYPLKGSAFNSMAIVKVNDV